MFSDTQPAIGGMATKCIVERYDGKYSRGKYSEVEPAHNLFSVVLSLQVDETVTFAQTSLPEIVRRKLTSWL